MFHLFRRAALAFIVLAVSAGCGKKESSSASTETKTTVESTATASAEPETTVAPPPTRNYKTEHNAEAVYGKADLPVMGSYLKLDFAGLSDNQLNRVIHRLRTENCTCGCVADPIDQCLVNDPNCTTAVALANQVIREEKAKS